LQPLIDPKRSLPRIREVFDGLTSVRHRAVLDVALRHFTLECETVWDVDEIMTTLVPEPTYHIWVDGTDVGPKGAAAVHAFYSEAVRSASTFLEFGAERVVVDDDCAVFEGLVKHVCSGSFATSMGMTIDGADALDPDGTYLVVYRNLIIIPVDDGGLMEGEDVYISGPSSVRRLTSDEIPGEYRALVAVPRARE